MSKARIGVILLIILTFLITVDAEEERCSGKFYPNPFSLWIIERTCGKCHAQHVD